MPRRKISYILLTNFKLGIHIWNTNTAIVDTRDDHAGRSGSLFHSQLAGWQHIVAAALQVALLVLTWCFQIEFEFEALMPDCKRALRDEWQSVSH